MSLSIKAQSIECSSYDFHHTMDSLLDLKTQIRRGFPLGIYSLECNIKKFAITADLIFSRGLTFDQRFKFVYRGNNISVNEEGEFINVVDSTNIKNFEYNSLIYNFCDLNEDYKNYSRSFMTFKGSEQIIENILKYGNFHHPEKVRDFLLFKYKKYNRDHFSGKR